MSKVVVRHCGDPSVLEVERVDSLPSLGPQSVRIRNAFAGVNMIDTYHRSGLYKLPLPFVCGSEGGGTVTEVGAAAPQDLLGKRVVYLFSTSGSYATYAVAEAKNVYVVPDAVAMDKAVAVLLQGSTAHYLTRSCYAVAKGSVVVVHAVAGGTGQLIAQVAKHFGAVVIGTCSPSKMAMARSMSDVVLPYIDENKVTWDTHVRRLYPNGVDAVYDGVGKTTFRPSLKVLRPRGAMISFGNASGPVDPISPLVLMEHGSVSLQRPTLKDFTRTREEAEQRLGDLFQWMSTGVLKVSVGHIVPLYEARRAHEMLESRQSTGKILLDCRDDHIVGSKL